MFPQRILLATVAALVGAGGCTALTSMGDYSFADAAGSGDVVGGDTAPTDAGDDARTDAGDDARADAGGDDADRDPEPGDGSADVGPSPDVVVVDATVDADMVVDARCGVCGDGMTRCDEQCDDGNRRNADGCDARCRLEPVGGRCGNGILDAHEACDDGNLLNHDHCNPTCNFENETSLLVGQPGVQGSLDGFGSAAQLGGWGVIIAVDDFLYYADGWSRRVRRIDVGTGEIVTIAGDGSTVPRDAPDGASAAFGGMEALATDGVTLWVGDSRRIRAVDLRPPHAVSTVAGDGTVGCGDGFGPAARFDDLRGLTYAEGYVWLLDSSCATVRRFDPVTREVVTVAGSPTSTGFADGFGAAARFQSPRYMTTDHAGLLYISDTGGVRIRIMDTATSEVTTLAGDGTFGYFDAIGTAAVLDRPRGLTLDGSSLYFTEQTSHTIRQIQLSSRQVSTMVGAIGVSGYVEDFGSFARLDTPFDVAYHPRSASLFVFDSGNFVIRRIR